MESRHWKTLATVLGVLLGTGTMVMSLGSALFVTRAEYVAKDRQDTVTFTELIETMKVLKAQLASQEKAFDTLRDSQTVSFDRMQDKMIGLQTDLAIIGERKWAKTVK